MISAHGHAALVPNNQSVILNIGMYVLWYKVPGMCSNNIISVILIRIIIVRVRPAST